MPTLVKVFIDNQALVDNFTTQQAATYTTATQTLEPNWDITATIAKLHQENNFPLNSIG